MKSKPFVAFVTDALPSLGGAEKVLFTALEAYPYADIFTLIYNKEVFRSTPLACRTITTSYLDLLPLAHRNHRAFLPLMPAAIERFDLRDYDIIVSFSYAVAHGAAGATRHVSYTYTPMRYAWMDININGTRTRKNPLVDLLLHRFRAWDKKAASRVHQIATVSQAVAQRIWHAYQREAPVIYPPVEVERFHPNPQRENFFITLSRLVPHKKIDLLVQAFSQLNLSLLIVGDGPDLRRLKSLARPNIQFLGFQPEATVAALLGKARAFVSASEEDFGIAMVEAQAAGCPVIAYGQGGALETVMAGVTGVLFSEQSVPCIVDAVERFECAKASFHTSELVNNAKRFGKDRFIHEFLDFVHLKPDP